MFLFLAQQTLLSENLMVALCTEFGFKKKFWSTCGCCCTIKQHLTKNITQTACFKDYIQVGTKTKNQIGCVTGCVWCCLERGPRS
jgi:hypothetical protein